MPDLGKVASLGLLLRTMHLSRIHQKTLYGSECKVCPHGCRTMGTCWTFRAGKSCSGCSYGHICYNCGAKHPANNCTSSGNQQRNRTSRQGPFGLLNSAEPDKVDRLYFLLQGYQSHLATYLVNGFR